MQRRRGFTLIELLIVIAVIALLAALLFPVFAQVREKSRAAACLSNLKQMGTAWMMYCQDYDERFPSAGMDVANPAGNGPLGNCQYIMDKGWFGGWIGNLLLPYTRNTAIFECPSTPQFSPVNYGGGPTNCLQQTRFPVKYRYVSYGYNYVALWDRGMADMARPADQLAIWDGNAWPDCNFTQAGSCGIWYQRDIPLFLWKIGRPLHPKMSTALITSTDPNVVRFRANIAPHNNGLNYMYADGHAKASRWDRLTWGNLAGHAIPDSHPDYNQTLMELPTAKWGQGVD